MRPDDYPEPKPELNIDGILSDLVWNMFDCQEQGAMDKRISKAKSQLRELLCDESKILGILYDFIAIEDNVDCDKLAHAICEHIKSKLTT